MFWKKKKDKVDEKIFPIKETLARNPYLAGREEWLERYGSYISRSAQWRAVAFGCLAVAGLSLAGNLVQLQKATVVPYFVSVDTLGRAAVARVENPGSPPIALIQAELSNVITNWRTVTADVDLQKKMLERVSMFTSGAARGVIQQYYTTRNPYALAKDGKLVQVTLKGLPLPVSTDSWRIEWTETTRSHAGAILDSKAWQATMRVQFLPPATDTQIMLNPGGIYVMELNFSAVLEPGR